MIVAKPYVKPSGRYNEAALRETTLPITSNCRRPLNIALCQDLYTTILVYRGELFGPVLLPIRYSAIKCAPEKV